MSNKIKIGLIGAGIGGITAAISLQQKGINPTIYEQAPELGEVGAGITIGPNANHVLNSLGLEEKLEKLAKPSPNVGTLHYKTGERLSYVPRGREIYMEKYGAVSRLIHRAELYQLLVDEIKDKKNILKLNHKLKKIKQDDKKVILYFENNIIEHCDVVIACDGIKSIVRDQLFNTQKPKFTGYVAWRGLVESAKVPDIDLDPHFAAYPAENKMFGRYPVKHKTLINYVAVARKPSLTSESWSQKAEVSEVLEEFNEWNEDVVRIINATPSDKCLRWSLYSRQPLKKWINGRVSLLGDAAHPMTPFYGMGAGMAIEDAIVLARCFDKYSKDWQDALKYYELARIGRANKMHLDSLERGDAFMSSDASKRSLPPSAGLDDDHYKYNAAITPI